MDFDFEKTIAMLDGKSAQDFEANQITDKDREIVAHAIDVLFTGLALREWLGNVTLGVAWLRAMDMLRDTRLIPDYVKDTDNVTPASLVRIISVK